MSHFAEQQKKLLNFEVLLLVNIQFWRCQQQNLFGVARGKTESHNSFIGKPQKWQSGKLWGLLWCFWVENYADFSTVGLHVFQTSCSGKKSQFSIIKKEKFFGIHAHFCSHYPRKNIDDSWILPTMTNEKKVFGQFASIHTSPFNDLWVGNNFNHT